MLALLIEDVTLIKQRRDHRRRPFPRRRDDDADAAAPADGAAAARHARRRAQADRHAARRVHRCPGRPHPQRAWPLAPAPATPSIAVSVQWVRFSAKLKSLKERLLAAGMLTSKQISAKLGVGRTTLGRWRADGLIKARICNDLGEWLYWPPERRLASGTPAHDPMVNSTAGGAV